MSFIYFAKKLVLNSALWQHLGVSIKFIKEKIILTISQKTFGSIFGLLRDYTLNTKLLTRHLVNVKVAVKLL